MKQRHTAGLFAALVLALAAFTGSAFAGGGNGSGGSNGNSANAPGHQDSSTPAAAPQAPAPQAAAPSTAKPSKSKAPVKQSKQSSTSAAAPASGGDNSHGVKPSNTTKHDTYAKASSDQTKKYGNGKTAGQIATKAGYGDATLHGPGNSQPHKVLCGGHEVDVHALAHKKNKCGTAAAAPAAKTETKSETKVESAPCATTTKTVTEQVAVGVKHMTGPKGSGRYVVIHPSLKSAHYDKSKHADDVVIYETVTKTISVPAADCSSQAPTVLSTTVTPPSSGAVAAATATQASPAAAGTQATAAAAPAATPATAAPAGAVKGAVMTLKPTKKAKPAGGVLGATTRLGGAVASARLPFTGLPLWIFAITGAALLGLGVYLRRSAADQI